MRDRLVGVFILLMGLFAAGMGASELREIFAAKTPTALTWPQFLERKPKAGWFKVSGAQLEVPDAMWIQENGNDDEIGHIYVPARVAGNESAEDAPIEMLVKIDDPKIAVTVKELKELDNGTDEAALKYVLSHSEQLFIERPLIGTLADGFDAVDSDDEKAIRRAEVVLADDFVILQEGAKPDKGGRIFMLLGGIGLSLLGLFYIFFKKTTPPAPPATASGYPPLSK